MRIKHVLFTLVTLFCMISSYLYLIPFNTLTCSNGVMASGASQYVCLMNNVVVKQNKPCNRFLEYKCHFNHIKQSYTNKKWLKVLNNHNRAIARIKKWDPLTFERTNHFDTTPNCTENLLRLRDIDKLLHKNGLIMTDVNKRSNLVLNSDGNVVLIDFNIFPFVSRPLIDKFDSLSKPLLPFNNIYGIETLEKWIFC